VLFMLSFLQAAVGTFFNPARASLAQKPVRPELRLQAGSVSQTTTVLAGLAGSAFAGLLYGLSKSFWLGLTFDAATFLVSFALVMAVRAAQHDRPASADPGTNVLTELLEGLRVITRNRLLLGLLIASGVTMLGFGTINVLFVLVVVNSLKVPPEWLGAIEGAQTVGMITSGVLIVRFASRINARTVCVVALLLSALTVGSGLTSNVIVFAMIMTGFGLIIEPISAAGGALAQQNTSNENMGRVGSTFGTVSGVASLLSMGLAGGLAATLGIQNIFFIAGGVIAIAAIACIPLLQPATAKTRPSTLNSEV
jgi:MFS family permease